MSKQPNFGPRQNLPASQLDMQLAEMKLIEGMSLDGEPLFSFQFGVVGTQSVDRDGTVSSELIPIAQGLAMLELAKLDFLARWRARGAHV